MPVWFSAMLEVGLLMMLALVGLTLVWMLFAVFRLRRDRAAVAEGERERSERLAEAVETGLVRVESGTPSDAVIACWAALEEAAAAIDVVREPSETPAEFTARVLGVSEVSLDDLSTLAALYREARYSSHPSTEAARAEARAALSRLHDELARTHSRLARSWR